MSVSEKHLLRSAIQIVQDKSISGEEFISMTREDLVTELGMSRSLAYYFYGRFLYWVHKRMDHPPQDVQKERKVFLSELPGGGNPVSRRL